MRMISLDYGEIQSVLVVARRWGSESIRRSDYLIADNLVLLYIVQCWDSETALVLRVDFKVDIS